MDDCARMERRERDKLARQQLHNPTPESSLFPEPVRVSTNIFFYNRSSITVNLSQ